MAKNKIIYPQDVREAARSLTLQDTLDYVDVEKFTLNLTQGQRYGQAWMNALDPKDYDRLDGSHWDPFYREGFMDIAYAIAFLLLLDS